MATRRNHGDSIECRGAELTARRFSPLRPKKHDLLGGLVFGFQISDYAVATIDKELSPKTPIVRQESLVDKGDRLSAEIISGFSQRKVPDPSLINRTGRHKAQSVTTSKFTYAQIDRKWQLLDN